MMPEIAPFRALSPPASISGILGEMESRTRRITNVYSGVSAVAAFVTQPVPMLDELIVVPIHYALCVKVARARSFSILKLPWKPIKKIIWYGAAARLVGNFSLGLVPVVGMFSNAITAIALTEYLGRYLDEAIANPDKPPPDVTMESLKALFTDALKKKQAEGGKAV
jgi:uncharacterized protein (DUF697 family)